MTLFSIDLERFQKLEQLFVKSGDKWKQLTLKNAQGYDDFAILHFQEINDRTEAEAFRDYQIYTDRDDLPELEDDEFYFNDLVGCEVIDEENNPLGVVTEVLTPGAHEVLVVNKADIETLIPLVDEWIVSIDAQSKLIQVRTVEEVR